MRIPSLQNNKKQFLDDHVYSEHLEQEVAKAKQENVDALEPEDAELVGFRKEK